MILFYMRNLSFQGFGVVNVRVNYSDLGLEFMFFSVYYLVSRVVVLGIVLVTRVGYDNIK